MLPLRACTLAGLLSYRPMWHSVVVKKPGLTKVAGSFVQKGYEQYVPCGINTLGILHTHKTFITFARRNHCHGNNLAFLACCVQFPSVSEWLAAVQGAGDRRQPKEKSGASCGRSVHLKGVHIFAWALFGEWSHLMCVNVCECVNVCQYNWCGCAYIHVYVLSVCLPCSSCPQCAQCLATLPSSLLYHGACVHTLLSLHCLIAVTPLPAPLAHSRWSHCSLSTNGTKGQSLHRRGGVHWRQWWSLVTRFWMQSSLLCG